MVARLRHRVVLLIRLCLPALSTAVLSSTMAFYAKLGLKVPPPERVGLEGVVPDTDGEANAAHGETRLPGPQTGQGEGSNPGAAQDMAANQADGRDRLSHATLAPLVKRLTGHLYFWVLLAILAGGVLGYADPATAVQLKPLGDGFIALVKMLISPIIFCTVVLGIAGAGRHEEGRPRRRQGVDLLRSRLDRRARHRPAGDQRGSAGRRLQRRSRDAGRQSGRRLRQAAPRRSPRPSSSSTSSR